MTAPDIAAWICGCNTKRRKQGEWKTAHIKVNSMNEQRRYSMYINMHIIKY